MKTFWHILLKLMAHFSNSAESVGAFESLNSIDYELLFFNKLLFKLITTENELKNQYSCVSDYFFLSSQSKIKQGLIRTLIENQSNLLD